MAVLYSNNASSTLSASITSTATSLSVASGAGALFPAPSGSDYFYITLVNSAGAMEIMKVTARSVDTLTVVRGQDGTTGVAWAAGDRVELRFTKAMLDDFKTDTRAGYLPLSGGTLTGTLNVNANDGLKATYGGTDGDTWYRGWGMESNRTTVYIRPTTNGVQSLRIGYSENTQNWIGVRVDANTFTHNGHNVLNANNYTNYAAAASHTHSYLPLSGGTLSSTVDGLLTLDKTSGTAWNYINFAAAGTRRFYFGLNASYEPELGVDNGATFRVNGAMTVGGNAVLTAGNYSSYALPNPGGGTGGRVLVNLSGNPSWSDASFTYDPIMGQFRATNFRANVGDAAPTWNFNAILHAGNYSNYAAPASHSHTLLTAVGLYSWDASTTPASYSQGIQSSFVSSSQGFQNYGSVLTMNTYSGGGGALQLYVPYSPTYGGSSLQIRQGNYDVNSGNSWTSWKTLLDSSNYTNYGDGRYVLKTGDTMSGNLKIQPASEGWSEGLSFLMPNTSTWGGIRWNRQRGNADGNWYIGYTALDASDDLVFGSNNGGTQVDSIIRMSKTGAITIPGLTTFSAPESINLKGARGLFTNQYIHLYNKVGIGNPSGWGQGEGSTPDQGLSTYGGINIAYGTNAASTFNGRTAFNRNGRSTYYTDSNIEVYTGDNTPPSIAFHRGGYSATSLYESDGELYVNAWTTRAQNGKLISSGNISTYVTGTSHNHTRLAWVDLRTAESGATYNTPVGYMEMVGAYNNGWPNTYGNVLSMNGGGGSQLFMGWNGGSGVETGELYYRSMTDWRTNWGSWRRILTSANWSEYAAPISHTHNYVLKTGDTMTGRLTIDGSGWTTNNRNYSNEWIEFGNYSGLYSPNNGAHFYPNNGSYGSWRSAGSRNGWAGIEFDASNGQMVLMIDPASNTSGFHNNSYGWQFRWNNGTAYVYKNAYGGGTAATVLDSSNYSNYALPIGGGWYGTGLPGSRWGGYSVNGGEISFGRDLPNTGQMGILVDGCYVAGENNGFWSMGSDNTWGSRRGMYWDGTYLRFDLGSPVSKMYALTVGNWDFYENSGGWNANIIAAGIYHGRVRVKASSYNSSGDQETYMWVDNTVTPSTGMYSTKNLFNFNGSITTVQVAGNTVLTGGNFTNYVPYGYPGWPGYPGTDANSFHSGSWLRSSFTYSNNAPHTGTIVHFPSSGYDLQLNGSYGGTSLSFRNRNGDNGTWNAWNTVLHSGNYTSYGDTKYLRGDGTTPVTPNNLNFGIGRYFGYTYIQTFNSEALQLNPIGNAVYINGNVAIHAGNISSYAGADTGAKGNIQIFNASGTFTVPAGITKLRITAFGGGGGGATQYAWTGGSGGCGIAIVTVTPGSSYTVTVGAGGRGAGWAGGAQAGGTTSFGSLVTATGGLGSVWNTVPPTSGTFTTTGTLIASSKLSGNNLSLMGGADGGTNYSYVAGGGGGMHGGGGAAGSTGGNSMYGAKGNNGTGNGAGTGGAGGSASGGAAGGAGGTYGSDGYTTAYGGGGGGAGGVIVEW